MSRIAVVINHALSPYTTKLRAVASRENDGIFDRDDALVVIAIERPGLQLSAIQLSFMHHEVEGMPMVITLFAHLPQPGLQLLRRKHWSFVQHFGGWFQSDSPINRSSIRPPPLPIPPRVLPHTQAQIHPAWDWYCLCAQNLFAAAAIPPACVSFRLRQTQECVPFRGLSIRSPALGSTRARPKNSHRTKANQFLPVAAAENRPPQEPQACKRAVWPMSMSVSHPTKLPQA